MKSNTFWILVVLLAILAVVSFLFSYWMVGVGLAVIVIALLISRGMQTRHPKPTE